MTFFSYYSILLVSLIFFFSDCDEYFEKWKQKSDEKITEKIEKLNTAHSTLKTRPARNVIFFVGDGMGITLLTAARIYNSQTKANTSYQEPFFFEKFPYAGLVKTHSTNSHVVDSAASATALFCGVKTHNDLLALSPDIKVGQMENLENSTIYSCLSELALKARKSVGMVTTTRVTHATPAALYAHCPNRRWEADMDVEIFGGNPSLTKDIARQMIEDYPANEFTVILGGGQAKFKPNCSTDDQSERLDNRNLIHEWQLNVTKTRKFVSTLSQLKIVDYENTQQLLGLFAPHNLPYVHQYDNDTPSLTEMSLAALKMLKKNDNGFFLFIEGGKIDMALHFNEARRSIEEVLALNDAVKAVFLETDPTETLIVVTADHSHNLNLVGFPNINTSILGTISNDSRLPITDDMPTTILTFADGPSAKKLNSIRQSLLVPNFSTNAHEFRQLSMIARDKASHGGEEVPVYATGPYSFLFTGLMDQTEIAHYIATVACVSTDKTKCNELTGGENAKAFSLKDITLHHTIGTILTFLLSVCLFVSLFINILLACRRRQ